MSTNRIIYNVQDVLVGPANSSQAIIWSDTHLLQRLSRVTAISYALDVSRKDIKQLGTRGNAANPIIDPPNVSLGISYITANISNEAKVGLNVDWNISGRPQYGIRPLLSGFADYDRLSDKRNLYLVVGYSGNDIHSITSKTMSGVAPLIGSLIDPNSLQYNIFCFSNCYLNSYTTRGNVGEFIQCSLGYVADNVSFFASGSGKIPEINPKTRVTNDSQTNFVIPKYYAENQPAALLPGGITLTLPTFTNLGADMTDTKIQGYEISVGIDRESVVFLGQNLPIDRRIRFPVFADVSLSMLVGDGQSGSFIDLVRTDVPYDMTIQVANPMKSPPVGQTVALRYDIKGAFFDSISYENTIGNNKTANLKFRVELDPSIYPVNYLDESGNLFVDESGNLYTDFTTTGIFVSGIVENPDVLNWYLESETEALENEAQSDVLQIETLFIGPTTF